MNEYLKDCVYFEIYDETLDIMNHFMFVSYRWIRGDDSTVFTPQDMENFLNAMFAVKDRVIKFSFYGKDVKKVTING